MAKYSHTEDEDDQITAPAYADDDDDDGWNHDNPTPTLDDPGVYRGRILADEGCIANLKPDGTGQVVFRIAPLGVVNAKLTTCTAELIPATQQQRFSMFISRTSNRSINEVRKTCAALGSATAATGVGLKPKVWAREVQDAMPEVHFTLAQRRDRPGYPSTDADGRPILEVTKLTVAK